MKLVPASGVHMYRSNLNVEYYWPRTTTKIFCPVLTRLEALASKVTIVGMRFRIEA